MLIGLLPMSGRSGPWVAMLAQHQLRCNGAPRHRINGKSIFTQIVEFRNRATADRFTPEVIYALRRERADALYGNGT